MKPLLTFIAFIGVILLALFIGRGCQKPEINYDRFYNDIAAAENQIAVLHKQNAVLNAINDSLKTRQVEVKLIYRDKVAAVKELSPDSTQKLFNAVTDTVDVRRDTLMVPVEVHRLTAANVLFTRLEGAVVENRILAMRIDNRSALLVSKDKEILALVEIRKAQCKIIEGKDAELKKQGGKLVLLKVVAGVELLIILL